MRALADVAAVHVTVSIPIWDQDRARAIEPFVATPARRLRIIETLARAGLSVGVNVAPVIPGLNDQDIPKILTAAREAGATSAGYVLLRLPGSVKAVFEERLRATLPLSADRVLHRIRETRGGELYDPRFGVRGRGEGTYAMRDPIAVPDHGGPPGLADRDGLGRRRPRRDWAPEGLGLSGGGVRSKEQDATVRT